MAKEMSQAAPRHVAIIMDGNGRWAKHRGLPRLAGHQQGVETVRRIVEACPDLGIEALTLYAFSTENWKRSVEEVDGLMRLFRIYMAREAERLLRENVRIHFIGRRAGLAADIQAMMDDLEERSRDGTRFRLNIALNYGGRDELTRAMQALASDVAAGRLSPDNVDEAVISARLDTSDLDDPDLVIRTSGEQRISNFLLWQAAYAEYFFTHTLWPDFSVEEFARIVSSFDQRERRFGAAAG